MIGARRASHPRHDGGETLIEILIALAITGIVVVGLVSGLTTVIIAGDTHRHLTDVEVVARQYGEAMVNQAYHPATTHLAADVSQGASSLTVTSSAGFPSAPFYVAVDAEVLEIASVSGTTWSLPSKTATVDDHAQNAVITYDVIDDACATSANLKPSFTVPAGAKFIAAPTVSAPLEFFDSTGSPISGGCAQYWQNVLPCSKFATPEHLTECDPALLRATITVSTTAASPNQASTTTRVLIRRGDA